MKYNNIHRIPAIILIIIVSFKLSSCEQEDLDFYIDCDHCLAEAPQYDTLRVQVTINAENPYVPLEFYIGDVEDQQKDWIDTARTENFWLVSEVGTEYSVKATYQKAGKTIVAIDSDILRVVDGEGECYPPCYYIRGGTLDVRLKE